MEEYEMDHIISNIGGFFSGRSIFVTGGTGFLGKALIEKLLRSCTNVKEIFLLIRTKKGMSLDQRLEKIFSGPLYDKLRETNPSAFAKVIPVKGDAAEEGLGLDPVERELIVDRVSVIFHVAASVRFDDNLRDAVFVNTRSTRDICVMASSMKKLVALVHVSSTYANADKSVINEVVYPSGDDWRKVIEIAENVDMDVLKAFTAKYMGLMPNTYTFTKRLAEDVIDEYSDRLPCVIFRPSIVIASIDDPVSGWLDNFNGPVGLMIGGGKGLVRVSYGNPNLCADYIPVDVTIKSMILVACVRGRIPITKDPSTHVYNCASQDWKQLSMQRLIQIGLDLCTEIPMEDCLWKPSACITQCYTYYYINVLLFHLMPALIIDMILKFKGYPPMLTKLQRRIYVSNKALSYFVCNEWTFCNNKLSLLIRKISGEDAKEFFFNLQLDSIVYLRNSLIGAKKYLLHEDMNQLDKAKRHLKRMTWIDRICKILFVALIAWISYKTEFLTHLCTSIGESKIFQLL